MVDSPAYLESMHYLLKIMLWLFAALGVLGGLIVGTKRLTDFIDNRIKTKISDPEFIKEIASKIRPYAIFDHKGRIIADGGAMNIIEDIKVEFDENISGSEDELFPEKIVIKPNIHLAQAPFLEALIDGAFINAERGERFDWIYTINYWMTTSRDDDKDTSDFRIEIIW